MNSKNFSEVMGELNSKYIEEALHYTQNVHPKSNRAKWMSLAACFCLMLSMTIAIPKFMQNADIDTPRPNIPPAQEEPGKLQADNIVIDETMTLEEALSSKPFGGYMLSEAPSGFQPESIRRYQDETQNRLSGLWSKGDGSFDEISWQVSYYSDDMGGRVTSVNDTKNYDLGLYSFPLADSVPEELSAVVDRPIFNIEELTLEAVSRRAYSINENDGTDKIRMSFGVRYGDMLIEVTTKGVSPEWVYEQLTGINLKIGKQN